MRALMTVQRWGLVGVMAAALVLTPPNAEAAELTIDVVDIGWWTRAEVPADLSGRFAVEQGVDGVVSLAALRIDSRGGAIRSATLHLREVDGVNQELGQLQICRTVAPWRAVSGGALSDAPAPSCPPEPVSPTRDGSGWTADVSALLDDVVGSASLMILPLPSGVPGQLVSMPFDVQFDAAAVQGSVDLVAIAPVSGGSLTTIDPPPSDRPTPAFPSLTSSSPDPTSPQTDPSAGSDPRAAFGSPSIDVPGAAGLTAIAGTQGRMWRWGLWLRIVLAGLLTGSVAAVVRWSLQPGHVMEARWRLHNINRTVGIDPQS